jgi:C_GCAxxG_C_C family probable redox protein
MFAIPINAAGVILKKRECRISRPEEASRRAGDYLLKGFNCSQSVLLTMQELLGLEDEHALKAATGFGGGVGNMGYMCGALAGGIMTLGLMYGRSRLEQVEEKERTYSFCSEWLKRFTERFGSPNCIDILKVDLKDPERRKEYWSKKENRERCARDTVGAAARILAEYLEEIE